MSNVEVRIIPLLDETDFEVHKLGPSYNAYRQLKGDLTPTLYYNQQILEDMYMLYHFKYLHSILNKENLKEGVILIKYWWSQRNSNCFGEVNGFHISMIMAYLLSKDVLTIYQKPPSIFRVTLQWLSMQIIPFRIKLNSENLAGFLNEELCFLMGPVNLLYYVLPFSFSNFLFESRSSLKLMEHPYLDRFSSLFTYPINFFLKYDAFLVLDINQLFLEFHPSESKQRKLIILIYNVLKKILASRFINVCIHSLKKNIIKFGLLVKRETLFKTKIPGPLFEEKDRCAQFLQFWGDSAKCVRQNDGIFRMEAIFLPNEQPDKIVQKIIVHLMKTHCGLMKTNSVKFYCETLWKIGGKKGFSVARRKLEKKVQKFQNILEELKQIPLQIIEVVCTHPALRLSSCKIPLPVPEDSFSNNYGSTLDSIPLVLTISRSSKWPEDTIALNRVKTAFYVKLGKILRQQKNLINIPSLEFLDVYFEGFVFRLKLFIIRELIIREAQQRSFYNLKYELMYLPLHQYLIRAVAIRFYPYARTLRICKQWCCCHLFTNISNEVIELLLTYIFVSPEPYQIPNASTVALQRFFNLVLTFQWKTRPIVVDPLKEINFDKDFRINKNLLEWRKSNEGKNIYIVTFRDQISEWFTLNSPSIEELKRMQKFSRISLKQFKRLRIINDEKKFFSIFKIPLISFDSLIQLDPINLSDYDLNMFKRKNVLKHRFQLCQRSKNSKIFPLCNFNLRTFYINDLQLIFGKIAYFYTNNLGGDQIVLKWKIKNREKRKEFFLDMLELGKGLIKKATFRI